MQASVLKQISKLTQWALAIGTFGFCFGLVHVVPVEAASPQTPEQMRQVEDLYTQGAAYYQARKYRRAIQKFEEGYAIFPEPNLLFNIARAHEALGEIDKAIENYRRCADAEGVDADIALKARSKADKLSQMRLRSAVTPDEAGTHSNEPIAPVRNLGQDASKQAPEETPSSWMGTAKWITGGIAAGLLIGGAVSLALGHSDHSDVEDAKDAAGDGTATMTQVEASDLIDSGDSKKAIGYALLGVGAATAAASVVFFVMDPSNSSQATESARRRVNVAIAPTRHSGATLQFSGTF